MNDYTTILMQPDRTLPDDLVPKDEDIDETEANEEERIYMNSILNKIKSMNQGSRDTKNTRLQDEPKHVRKENISKKIQVDKKKRETRKPDNRQFNPRLPLPILKYNNKNRHITFNLNTTDFPTL